MKTYSFLQTIIMCSIGAGTLISCAGEFSPKSVDGYEFTGDGVFGNIPYISASQMSQERARSGIFYIDPATKSPRASDIDAILEYQKNVKEEVSKKDSIDVPCELRKDGKSVDVAAKLKFEERSTINKYNIVVSYKLTEVSHPSIIRE